ncbi:uncharacterized protein ASCRUDRAFT_76757 [Ascoidea rubescens DSM 1968]|uniref:Uncharacterized protein n=1 Tax=Ascoidea rubescens DSM 1968 TaxID=1344418 RepID=A0A1D2VDT5_9ASCO|nr:hypothetical protein ASCRUDRAFT_76757 [Ascoidea rubescens DSM 1968]ODV59795.1 hypothetical protein ASCRUDRAFT_76757 [Ascoidea rubescens DSM 1968]
MDLKTCFSFWNYSKLNKSKLFNTAAFATKQSQYIPTYHFYSQYLLGNTGRYISYLIRFLNFTQKAFVRRQLHIQKPHRRIAYL